MLKCITPILLTLATVFVCRAQVSQNTTGDLSVYGGNSGSPYSAFGIGDILSPGFGQIGALAGTGIGLANPYFVNTVNPAALTSIESPVSMIFDFGLNFGLTRTRSEENSPFQIDGGLTALNLWFRINRNWSSNLGLQVYSKIGYNLAADRYDLSAGGDYQFVYTGKGGLNRLYWGNGFQLTKNLSLGLDVDLLFGTIEEAQTFIGNSVGTFSINSKNYLKGSGFNAGLQYKVRMGKNNLVLGLTYGSAMQLASEKNSQLLAQQDTLEQVEIWDEAFKIPHKFGAGFSFKTSRNLTFAGDFTWQPWSEGKLNDELILKDTRAVSFGLEFIPSYDKYLGYYQQTLLRAGIGLREAYLEFEGRQVKQWEASLGIGLPFNRFRHHLNLSYSYRHRGNSSLLETQHQLSLHINLRDIWFMRPKIQ